MMARRRCTHLTEPETLPARALTPEEAARWRVYADSAEGQLFLDTLRRGLENAARRELALQAAAMAEATRQQNSVGRVRADAERAGYTG